MRAVERIRSDNPMWGKEKIFVLLTREGIAASVSMVGRILKSLMERGVVTPYDPVAKWTVGLVARRATALCATALLDKLAAEAPFPIAGIQVDGGSEFRAEFEKACASRNLTLFVLPPKRPQLNGHVERAQ